ncbi:phage baseplate upper protein [Staphylococcus xylosus]|uniref:phage baseplate upper protein n=1 Tax=Staphylococcus xylosus TaxID=1288 RepID=UPI000D1D30BE|nr:phage baseplate upper protein [Staphylococcus xylosus]PTI64486.1 hypothetical protein BU095_05205 [Staphylococcus xylosus]
MAFENFLKDDNGIELKTTSKQQNLGNTNIQFYNMDSGTAVLNFIVTKNERPFEIGPSNANAYIALKTDNYTVDNGAFISDDLNFVDPINGRLSYTLPDSILAYTGTVHGQVYFAQNGTSNIIVEREFTFTVANDLISNIHATTKLTYIKTLNDMTESIKDEVELIKESLSGGRTVAEGINQTVADGITQLEHKKNETMELITTLENEKSSIFEEKIDGFLNEVESRKTAIDSDITRLQTQMSEANLLLSTDAENWQKYAFTQATGYLNELNEVSIEQTLKNATGSAIYHITNATDAPSFNITESIPATVTPPTETITTDTDTGVNDDVVENSDTGIYDDPEESGSVAGETPTPTVVESGKSGILKIFKADGKGRATWEPDDLNEVYTRFYQNSIWYQWGKINDEGISKEYIANNIQTSLNSSKSYTDEKVSQFGGQKYPLTNDDGTLIQVNLDYGLSKLYALKSGVYYATNVPELPSNVKSVNGYLKVYYKDTTTAYIEFTPVGGTTRYIKQLTNGTWSAFYMPDSTNNVVLFEGSATGIGTQINLTDSYKNYSSIKISVRGYGGDDVKEFEGNRTSNIVLYTMNVTDTDGSDGHISETKVVRTSEKVLTIENEVTWRFKTLAGQPVTNGVVITKIVGVK